MSKSGPGAALRTRHLKGGVAMRDLDETLVAPRAAESASVDLGLRRYMLAVYNKVALGLVLASGLAYATSSLPVVRDLMFKAAAGSRSGVQLTLFGVLVALAPILVLLLSQRVFAKPTPRSTGIVYWTVVALFGAAMGVLVLNFTGLSIVTTLAISAATFGGLSLIGYTTRRDLTGLGAFLTMGVIGLLATMAINLFLRSPAALVVTNLLGTLIFAGLIAFDTQRLKMAYDKLGGDEAARGVASNCGALSLFINFLNLVQFLLLAMSGQRR
jgi:FtsH-binding integral membrane protein